MEQRLAADSLAWVSPGRQEQEAQRAGVSDAFGNAREETRRALVASGADPTTIAALEASGRLEEDKATAGAKDTARRDVEQTGLAYLDNAAKFGRNMPSTGIATAQLAGQQGQAAQGGYSSLAAATAMPAQAAGNLYSGAVGANSAAGSLYLGQYKAEADAAAANRGIFGDVLSARAGLLGMSKNAASASGLGMLFSSKRLKDVGAEVDGVLAALSIEKSPSVCWTYKPGMGDGSTQPRLGPTAESLRDATGGLVSDGTKVDGIALLGLHHAGIGNVSERLRKIEAHLGLEAAHPEPARRIRPALAAPNAAGGLSLADASISPRTEGIPA